VSERTSPTQQVSRPGGWTLLRDVLSFTLGWGLIGYEVLFQDSIREPVLLLAGAVVGVPGLALGASSVAESLRSRSGTPSASESAQLPASPPSPPS
jgi:hypothetical protein